MPNQQENYSQTKIELIKESDTLQVWNDTTDYIRLTVYESDSDLFIGRYYSNKLVDNLPQIEVYITEDDLEDTLTSAISVKPNEILERNYVAGGDYKLQFDFLRNILHLASQDTNSQFIITEISPSRKEIRLLAKTDAFGDISFDTTFINNFNNAINVGGEYTYDCSVTFDREKNISINNFTFDLISNPEKPSLILRLDTPISTQFKKLDKVNIEKEVINTQIQNILYVSNITSVYAGQGLTADTSVWDTEVIYEQDEEQNFQELVESASFTENTLEDIYWKQNEDPNLNIDFNEFTNHTLFGSATKKLENFRTKVGNIQGYYETISSSLSISGSATGSYLEGIRKNAFSEIQKIKNTFTPYERFLYTDAQSQTTASAPGLGINFAHSIPVNRKDDYTLLTNHEGFKVVHKHQASENQYVDLFTNLYLVEESPFFNYTGSLYLSFLIKAENIQNSTGDENKFNWHNANRYGFANDIKIPKEAMYKDSIQRPDITGSHYQRVILEASQSHWRPTGSAVVNGIGEIGAWGDTTSNWVGKEGVYYQILSSSEQVASASTSASSYLISLPENYVPLGTTLTSSNTPFTGSVLPSGELFRVHWNNPLYENAVSASQTSSFTTDIKITKNNPLNAQPFSFIYPTGSSEFDNWYTNISASAATFDENNIHSLKQNVPEKLISDSEDVQNFLHMWGEHFDKVRNYIDTYKTFYNRGYNELDSVPSNLLPVLGDNLGWELINPFSSSLGEYFSELTGSSNNVQDITNNTWRKILNNLIYVYKSKGTQNSLRALLNIYGYPPDLINVRELGGSSEEHNPVIIDDTFSTFDVGMENVKGNVSFIREPMVYRMMNFSSTGSLRLDWQTNDAIGDALELTMIPNRTTTSMSLFKSSGSQSESFWDVQYVPSASSATVGSLRFRLHYGEGAESATGSLLFNVASASTDYFTIGNDKMFNVYVGNETGTDNNIKTLIVSSKENDTINLITTASIDVVSLASSADHDIDVVDVQQSHINFTHTGSSISAGSNLYVGETFNGKISDIRLWKSFLSASKIKQHTLNPTSVVGNDFNSMDSELVWRFRLNENYPSGSISSSTIVDSNPDNVKDFSKEFGNEIYDSTYATKIIDTIKFVPRTDGVSQFNTKMTTTDIDRGFMKNELDPFKSSFISNYDNNSSKKRSVTTDVEFTRSPSHKINSYISDILADKDVSQYFSKWSDLYEPVYSELDSLRDKILSNVSVDINRYIAAQARLFNPFLIEAINALLPERSNFKYGVTLEDNILERTKIKYYKSGLVLLPLHTGTISDIYNFDTSVYLDIYKGELEDEPDLSINFTSPSKGDITLNELFDYSVNYLNIYKSNNLNIYEDTIDFNINYNNIIESNILSILNQEQNLSFIFKKPYESNILNLYEDIINYNIDFIDVTKSNIMDIYNDFITYSILHIKPYESDNIKIYEDFVSYIINYIETKKMDISNWKFNEFSINYTDIIKSNIEDWPHKSLEMLNEIIYSSNIDKWPHDSFEISNEVINEFNIERWPFKSFGILNQIISESNIERWPFEKFEILNLALINSNNLKIIDDDTQLSFSYLDVLKTNLNLTYDKDLNINPYFEMKYNKVYTKDIFDVQNLSWVDRKESPLKNWGRKLSDTWIMNMNHAGSGSNAGQSYEGDHNTGYYNDTVLNYMIGDMEYHSGSHAVRACTSDGAPGQSVEQCVEGYKTFDASNSSHFKNRLVFNDGITKDIYTSFDGLPVLGKPIGKTTYIMTGSDGSITYPTNHYINYHDVRDQLRHLYYRRTPVNPIMIDSRNNFFTGSYSRFHFPNEKDLFPTEEVYTVSVQGADTENILRVEKPGDRAGNIEYGPKATGYGKTEAQLDDEKKYYKK